MAVTHSEVPITPTYFVNGEILRRCIGALTKASHRMGAAHLPSVSQENGKINTIMSDDETLHCTSYLHYLPSMFQRPISNQDTSSTMACNMGIDWWRVIMLKVQFSISTRCLVNLGPTFYFHQCASTKIEITP